MTIQQIIGLLFISYGIICAAWWIPKTLKLRKELKMTGKRFTNVEVDDYYHNLICVNDGDTFHSYSEKGLEDLLNELSDENEELKQFQNNVAKVIESKMEDNVCNDYKMEVLKEIWNELELDK